MFAHLVNEVSRDVACAVCTQEIQALLDEHRLVPNFARWRIFNNV